MLPYPNLYPSAIVWNEERGYNEYITSAIYKWYLFKRFLDYCLRDILRETWYNY